MNDAIRQALERDELVDITTIGRKSGQPRRIEIGLRYYQDKVYLAGRPGSRSWYANLVANPEFTFHVKQSHQADLPARAAPILDEARRRELFTGFHQAWGNPPDVEEAVRGSRLMEVEFRYPEA